MTHYKNEKPNIPLYKLIKNTKKNQEIYINPVSAVMGVIKRKGKFLVVKKYKSSDYWAFVAGFIEAGESAEKAIEREVKEETNVKTRAKKIISTFPYFDEKIILMIVLELEYISGKAKANDDIKVASWVKLDKYKMKPRTLGRYVFTKWFANKKN